MAAFTDIDVASSSNHLAAIKYKRVKSLFELRFHRVSIGRSNVKNNIGSHLLVLHQSRLSGSRLCIRWPWRGSRFLRLLEGRPLGNAASGPFRPTTRLTTRTPFNRHREVHTSPNPSWSLAQRLIRTSWR